MPTVAKAEQGLLPGFEVVKGKQTSISPLVVEPSISLKRLAEPCTEFEYWHAAGFEPIIIDGRAVPTRWPKVGESLRSLSTTPKPPIPCPETPLPRIEKKLLQMHKGYQAKHRFARCQEAGEDIDRSPQTKRQKMAIREKGLRSDEGLAYFNKVISPMTAVAEELKIKPRIAIKDPEVRKRGHYKENIIRFRGWQTSWRGQKARARTH